ncbi:MAG: SDR family oxidoreductase [Oscillospiraceae bacterium]|nr:SDR family oxidoreductase [Oscillospiraceae bacterium]
MKTIDLKQQVVLVTGGTGGIGGDIVRTRLAANAKVAATYRSEKAMEEAKAAFAGLGTVEFFPLDMEDTAAIGPCVESIVKAMGPITGLVECAGMMAGKAGLELTVEEWDKLMDVNARGNFFLMQAVVEQSMKEHGGSMVAIASMAGIRGMVPPLQTPHYCASKAAVVAITKQAAVEWAELGVRCNCIAPGGVKAGRMAGMKKEDIPPFLVANVPMRDLVEPQCIADTVLYLLSDMSCSMTGQCLVIDGGSTACGY